jgi:hypothetical protein
MSGGHKEEEAGMIMEKLSERSQAIIERFKVHQARCLTIGLLYGYDSSIAFHKRHKAKPASEEAKAEFERLIAATGN